ncbi:hypothetical protein [Mesorhizobium sp. LNJC394B00]|uniref:hypothetical protein n=1 Tax=unclassified Mesorhizobium TaxID=325217 RepID=UPI0032AF5970
MSKAGDEDVRRALCETALGQRRASTAPTRSKAGARDRRTLISLQGLRQVDRDHARSLWTGRAVQGNSKRVVEYGPRQSILPLTGAYAPGDHGNPLTPDLPIWQSQNSKRSR